MQIEEQTIKMQQLLAKMRGTTAGSSNLRHISVTHAPKDILAAKNVLYRLLTDPIRNEVSSIKYIIQNIEEA